MKFPGRNKANQLAIYLYFGLAILPVLLVLVIFVLLYYKSSPILEKTSLIPMLSDQSWLPSQGEFGFSSFIMGTICVTGLAVFLAVPPCVLGALYLSEYASSRVRGWIKPVFDIFAAIPSVVFGIWGVIVIVPFVKDFSGLASQFSDQLPFLAAHNTIGYSILAAGMVLALMICPYIVTLSYEVLRSVPDGYRQAPLALGATTWQMIKHVILPKSLPGILAAIVLGISRALGETMAVVMVVGNVPRNPTSIFDAAYTLPGLIANNYGEMLSIKNFDAALMLAALILLVMVMFFNLGSAFLLKRVLKRQGQI